jgi:hypothetical protein
MTEDQIERQVERMIDKLDAEYLHRPGLLSLVAYNERVIEIDEWAKARYAEARHA